MDSLKKNGEFYLFEVIMMDNIEFTVDNCTETEAKDFLKSLDVPKGLPIFEVELQLDMDYDEYTMFIYIENGDVTEMRQDTYDFLKQLQAREYDAFVSDEDYGGSDVIIITFERDTE